MRAYWTLVVVLAACGNPAATGDDAMIGGGSDGAMGDAGDGWTTLIQRTWTENPGSESFRCERLRIPADMYISAFRAVAPPGTHHEIVSLTTTTGSGDFDCTPSALSVSTTPGMLYAAGIGTADFNFPAGVAVKLAAGTYIQLYVHVYNASDATSTQTSGVQVKLASPADVVHEADMMLGGRTSMFTIPSTGTPYDVVADCGATENWHIVGLWPHMHEYGIHQNVAVRRASVVINTLLDTGYDFNNEQTYAMDQTVLANDRLGFDCTYLNNTGAAITGGGDGAAGETCLTGFFKYPANDTGGNPYYCTN